MEPGKVFSANTKFLRMSNRIPESQLQQQLKEAQFEIENYQDASAVDLMTIHELKAETDKLLLLHTENYHKVESLTAALTQSVEIIKQWRTKAAASSGKSKEIIEDIWQEYYDHSPEMKQIREILKEVTK